MNVIKCGKLYGYKYISNLTVFINTASSLIYNGNILQYLKFEDVL